MKIKRVEVKKPFDGYEVGSVHNVKCDRQGTPLELSWRRRFKDAKTDNCCEVVVQSQQKPKSKLKSSEED